MEIKRIMYSKYQFWAISLRHFEEVQTKIAAYNYFIAFFLCPLVKYNRNKRKLD